MLEHGTICHRPTRADMYGRFSIYNPFFGGSGKGRGDVKAHIFAVAVTNISVCMSVQVQYSELGMELAGGKQKWQGR